MSAYRAESLVRLSYELQPDDMIPPSATRRRGIRRVAIATSIVVGVVSAILFVNLPPWFAALGSASVAGLLLWTFRRAVRAPKPPGNWEARRHAYLEASEEHFAIGDGNVRYRFAWDLIIHWRETDTLFVVFSSPSAFHVVPKRALPDTALTTLRQLLESRVPTGGEAILEQHAKRGWVPLAIGLAVLALLLGSVVEGIARALT